MLSTLMLPMVTMNVVDEIESEGEKEEEENHLR